jgi:hypothetical protein
MRTGNAPRPVPEGEPTLTSTDLPVLRLSPPQPDGCAAGLRLPALRQRHEDRAAGSVNAMRRRLSDQTAVPRGQSMVRAHRARPAGGRQRLRRYGDLSSIGVERPSQSRLDDDSECGCALRNRRPNCARAYRMLFGSCRLPGSRIYLKREERKKQWGRSDLHH